jgi:tetratricopeptide (TPR) repeat protein
LPAKFDVVEHHGHTNATVGCVDCHMPSTTYMGVDDRRDHGFRVPRPDLTVATGVPNACANCHAEQTPDWAANALSDWHGDSVRDRPQFATALAAGRSGYANAELVAAIIATDTPGIARATAISLLAAPFSQDDFRVIQGGLLDPDPLVRIAALRTLRYTPSDFRLQQGFQLLTDDVRGVRIEAVLAYADVRYQLQQGYQSEFSKAALEFRQSLEFLAERPESHAQLGGFAAASGDLQQAAEHYERALAMEPRSIVVRVNLSDTYRMLGEDVRGEALFKDGLRLFPNSAPLHHAYGLLLVRLQRADEALIELREAADLAPDSARYGYVLAVAYHSLGRPDDAAKLVRELSARYPNEPNIRALRESL